LHNPQNQHHATKGPYRGQRTTTFTGEMASLQDPSSKCLASGSGLKPAIARVDIVMILDMVATTDSENRDNIGYVQS
jgi:hypothetical protein